MLQLGVVHHYMHLDIANGVPIYCTPDFRPDYEKKQNIGRTALILI
jgi:hypothetical protein